MRDNLSMVTDSNEIASENPGEIVLSCKEHIKLGKEDKTQAVGNKKILTATTGKVQSCNHILTRHLGITDEEHRTSPE